MACFSGEINGLELAEVVGDVGKCYLLRKQVHSAQQLQDFVQSISHPLSIITGMFIYHCYLF